jgi:hypothetical protein
VLERGWKRATVGVVAFGVLVGVGLVGPSAPAQAQDGSDLVEACTPVTEVPDVGPRACKSVESGTWLTAQICRLIIGRDETVCPALDGRPVHEPAMADFEASWLARALALQRQLDLDVPLSQALLPHTHNSANSSAYPPSVTTFDANQVLTLTDQLRLGMRAIEIDVHWTPNPAGDPDQRYRAVVQCHGEPVATEAGVVHAGCSTDMPLVDLLAEVRAWLARPANADEVLLLYLENALDDDPAAHAAAVAAIEETLGDLVARPDPGAGCQDLPVARSKAELLEAGTRVLITGNCGPGAWVDWVFERGAGWDESGGSTFDCTEARTDDPDDPNDIEDFDGILVRRYEDSTWLSAMAGSGSHVDADTITEMVRCGINLVGFDQLHPGDDRLPGLVWSWRVDEPALDATDSCAALGSDSRFFADACATPRPVACRTTTGGWAVTADAVAWSAGEAACQTAGHTGAGVPANGRDSGLLREAADQAGAPEVWLAYAQDAADVWVTGVPGATTELAAPAPNVSASGRSGERLAETQRRSGPAAASGGADPSRPSRTSTTLPVTGGTPQLLAVLLIASVLVPGVLIWRRRGDTAAVEELLD